ncbi:peptidyl-prolyl cis-trans isomerase [Sagittula salina]|uniref:Peptidyl-prolyl cis-trans isomerase n=1 Tax=Sagittula salina TaxID=2820268 RepID=A0A940MMF9_9RHOB|nr:peptidyl-prolyl cis-trans isomerase [Sagittula salina]MBP0482034.1 peptidyl-prolyl cis-trans isomerase [Sagittula salina]
MSKKSGGVGKTAGYILLGMLLLGLGGFGATNFGGRTTAIGTVGDTDIPAQDYFRALRSEINARQAQTGQPLTLAQARAEGVTDAVLARVLTTAALEHEAKAMGLSVGDTQVAQDVRAVQAFQGIDGRFSRENYRMALENAGYSEREFEESLRGESAAQLLQTAVQGGVTLPSAYVDTLIAYTGERRAFTWAEVDTGLDSGLPTPTEDELRAFYEAGIDRYTRPETRQITYAWVTPEMIIDSVEVDEAALRKAYEERQAEFNMPERRLVERLVMPNEAEARDAAEKIAAGTQSFAEVVASRGLNLADTDLGDVNQDDLGAAGEAVFGTDVGEVVMAPSNLGPALFRVNGVLPATATAFEDAIPDLRGTLALDKARRVIDGQINALDEELAAGVTLEELAETTDLQLGTIAWTGSNADDIAGYDAFKAKAAGTTPEDYPEMAELGDGGLFALRVDSVQPPAPIPFDEVRDRVTADWEVTARADARAAQAEDMKTALANGESFEDHGLSPKTQSGLTRNARAEGLPPGAIAEVFDLERGQVAVLKGAGTAWLLRLDEILPADLENDVAGQLRQIFAAQADQDVAQDLYRALAIDVQQRAGVTIDQQAVNAVQANFQ